MGGAAGRSPQGGHRSFVARGRRFRGRRAGPRRPFLPPGDGESRGLRRPGPAQREPRAGPRQGAAPTPPPGRWGGPRRGRSGKTQAGHGRRQGRQPHAKAATASDRATATTAERPGGGAAAPRFSGGQQRDRTQADHGPGAPPPATSQHQRRRGPTGRGRTRPGRCDGAGAAGPGQYRPGLHPTGRIPFMFAPAGQTAPQGREPRTGTAGRRALRPAAWRHGRREVRTEAGAIPPGRGAASAAKKMPGSLPPGWTATGRKKCGEDALSPPLAVTADTRFPPVRRSSPKRTRCRPIPYALAVRLSPGLRSCVP